MFISESRWLYIEHSLMSVAVGSGLRWWAPDRPGWPYFNLHLIWRTRFHISHYINFGLFSHRFSHDFLPFVVWVFGLSSSCFILWLLLFTSWLSLSLGQGSWVCFFMSLCAPFCFFWSSTCFFYDPVDTPFAFNFFLNVLLLHVDWIFCILFWPICCTFYLLWSYRCMLLSRLTRVYFLLWLDVFFNYA